MNQIKSIEDAMELSLLALESALTTIEATQNEILVGLAKDALAALNRATHDPESDDIRMPYWRSLVCPKGVPTRCDDCRGHGTLDGECECSTCDGWGMIFARAPKLEEILPPWH